MLDSLDKFAQNWHLRMAAYKDKLPSPWLVAESCSAGLLASVICAKPGASAYFRGGYVIYQAQQKLDLGVDSKILQEHGAVSEQSCADLLRLLLGKANTAIVIVGNAGPSVDSGRAQVGDAYVGLACKQVVHQSAEKENAENGERDEANQVHQLSKVFMLNLPQIAKLGRWQFNLAIIEQIPNLCEVLLSEAN